MGVITTPKQLACGIMPSHEEWIPLSIGDLVKMTRPGVAALGFVV